MSVRFTKAKVLYWIVDHYRGELFKDVDSAKVGTEKEMRIFLSKEIYTNQRVEGQMN